MLNADKFHYNKWLAPVKFSNLIYRIQGEFVYNNLSVITFHLKLFTYEYNLFAIIYLDVYFTYKLLRGLNWWLKNFLYLKATKAALNEILVCLKQNMMFELIDFLHCIFKESILLSDSLVLV